MSQSDPYQLIDSGNAAKLEQFGPVRMVRPAPQAVWLPRQPRDAWEQADAVFTRHSSGGGDWSFRRPIPETWTLSYRSLSFRIKPTAFGHLGLFPEHARAWDWLERQVQEAGPGCTILNLFAYTGGATLAAARAGAKVCHLDASKGVVSWARENAALSGLEEKPIRWIVEDVAKFLQRERRRGVRYDGLVLDPPSFGRGSKGEVFKIEKDLPALLQHARSLLAKRPRFVLLSCHSPGFTPQVLANLLEEMMEGLRGRVQHQEMALPDASGRVLPSGAFAEWVKSDDA